jgi:hypothetical protein
VTSQDRKGIFLKRWMGRVEDALEKQQVKEKRRQAAKMQFLYGSGSSK